MFSEVVDNIIKRSARKDSLADIAAYVNQTVRECQSDGFFSRDLVEDQLTPTATPFVWNRPALFRKLRTVKYSQTGYEDIYPDFKMPGRVQKERDLESNYYYSAGTYFVFAGVQLSQLIPIAYYTHLARLYYYPGGRFIDINSGAVTDYLAGSASPFDGKILTTGQIRPAVYDETAQVWYYYVSGSNSYVTNTTGDPDADAAAQALVSNWLLNDYRDMTEEGGLSKIFKNKSDPRAVSCFALYKQLQEDLKGNETFETLNF